VRSLRHAAGRRPTVRAITDLRPVARVIAALTRGTLFREWARFVACELAGVQRTDRYRLREGGIVVWMRHNTPDLDVLSEVFLDADYEPPVELGGLAPARILDLGANVGLFGAWALARWPGAAVEAYEPDPANAAVHRRTVAANPGLRWVLHEAAAAAAPGELRFAAGGFATSGQVDDGANGLAVRAVDVLPAMAGADLVKIDIEGGEWALLTDPRLRDAARVLVLEYHPRLAPEPDARACALALLQRAGYATHERFHDEHNGHGMLWAWRG
jgi:FkbM family methyltransferase